MRHFWDLRRFAHVVLLIVLIVGIRACGGATQAEDRLSFATRWAADRAGLKGAKDTIDSSVKPRMASATQSMTYSIFAATNRLMDGAESAASGMATWVGEQTRAAETAVATQIRSILGVSLDSKPEERGGPSTDADKATESPR
ncbi:MAG TPA: hypothetical protein VFU28_16205 [Vicinamibacterales bacterium]|nr:hypothetical protein [Vicinamibacterales bacterium]